MAEAWIRARLDEGGEETTGRDSEIRTPPPEGEKEREESFKVQGRQSLTDMIRSSLIARASERQQIEQYHRELEKIGIEYKLTLDLLKRYQTGLSDRDKAMMGEVVEKIISRQPIGKAEARFLTDTLDKLRVAMGKVESSGQKVETRMDVILQQYQKVLADTRYTTETQREMVGEIRKWVIQAGLPQAEAMRKLNVEKMGPIDIARFSDMVRKQIIPEAGGLTVNEPLRMMNQQFDYAALTAKEAMLSFKESFLKLPSKYSIGAVGSDVINNLLGSIIGPLAVQFNLGGRIMSGATSVSKMLWARLHGTLDQEKEQAEKKLIAAGEREQKIEELKERRESRSKKGVISGKALHSEKVLHSGKVHPSEKGVHGRGKHEVHPSEKGVHGRGKHEVHPSEKGVHGRGKHEVGGVAEPEAGIGTTPISVEPSETSFMAPTSTEKGESVVHAINESSKATRQHMTHLAEKHLGKGSTIAHIHRAVTHDIKGGITHQSSLIDKYMGKGSLIDRIHHVLRFDIRNFFKKLLEGQESQMIMGLLGNLLGGGKGALGNLLGGGLGKYLGLGALFTAGALGYFFTGKAAVGAISEGLKAGEAIRREKASDITSMTEKMEGGIPWNVVQDVNKARSYGAFGFNEKGMLPGYIATYGKQFGITASIGTPEFDKQFNDAMRKDPQAAYATQRSYLMQAGLFPLTKEANKRGIDTTSSWMKQALTSMAGNHGPEGQKAILNAAVLSAKAQGKEFSQLSPADQAETLYFARDKYVQGLPNLSPETKAQLHQRYIEKELPMIKGMQEGIAISMSPSSSVVKSGVAEAKTIPATVAGVYSSQADLGMGSITTPSPPPATVSTPTTAGAGAPTAITMPSSGGVIKQQAIDDHGLALYNMNLLSRH